MNVCMCAGDGGLGNLCAGLVLPLPRRLRLRARPSSAMVRKYVCIDVCMYVWVMRVRCVLFSTCGVDPNTMPAVIQKSTVPTCFPCVRMEPMLTYVCMYVCMYEWRNHSLRLARILSRRASRSTPSIECAAATCLPMCAILYIHTFWHIPCLLLLFFRFFMYRTYI